MSLPELNIDKFSNLWKNRRAIAWISFTLIIISWFVETFLHIVVAEKYVYSFGGVLLAYFVTAILFDIFPRIQEVLIEWWHQK